MTFDFFKLLALISDPVMHFRPQTSFRGIEDVEFIPKFDYRNFLNPIILHVIAQKDAKGYTNLKKNI